MKSHTEYLWFNTKKHREFINITHELEKALAKAQIKEGLVLASAMHITAGVYINDAEDGLIADIDEWLEKLAPFRADYRHHRTGETNGIALFVSQPQAYLHSYRRALPCRILPPSPTFSAASKPVEPVPAPQSRTLSPVETATSTNSSRPR